MDRLPAVAGAEAIAARGRAMIRAARRRGMDAVQKRCSRQRRRVGRQRLANRPVSAPLSEPVLRSELSERFLQAWSPILACTGPRGRPDKAIRSMKEDALASSEPYLRSAEAARRLGVSGKALRLYE